MICGNSRGQESVRIVDNCSGLFVVTKNTALGLAVRLVTGQGVSVTDLSKR